MHKFIHYEWIKIKCDNYYYLLNKIADININIYESKYHNNHLYLLINNQEFERLNKYLVSYKIIKVSDTGIYKIKNIVKKYYIFLIALFIGFIYLIMINHTIIKIEIVNNDEKIVSLVKDSLDKYNLKILRPKKDHFVIERIVEKILDDNKDKIEWLEIKYDGLKMIVEVTEKVEENLKNEYDICNVISSSDAKIIGYNLKKGEPLFKLNQYVYKNEVLVTGIIKHNEEIKDTVCASATIYGEVWYKVNISVPKETKEYIETGKNKYNFEIVTKNNKYKILKSRLENFREDKESLYELNDFKIMLVKEKEIKMQTVRLTDEEAYLKGLDIVTKKILDKLDDDEEILVKKVLKNNRNDSTIDLEVFVAVKEKINKQVEVKEVELNDIERNRESNS